MPHPHSANASLNPVMRLHQAVRRGNAVGVTQSVAEGANVNAPGPGGDIALVRAVVDGRVEVVRALLAGGARPDATSSRGILQGATALRRAVNAIGTRPDDQVEELVACLMAAGAAVDGVDGHGCTHLMEAATHGSCRIMAALVRGGADVHARDRNANTALHWAARQRDPQAVRWLLDAGADWRAVTGDGATAEEIARMWVDDYGTTAVVDVLVAWRHREALEQAASRDAAGPDPSGAAHRPHRRM